MALPQDGQNANGLTKVTEIPKGKELIFIDPTTNEGGIITLEDLTTQILKNLTSQTFTLDQGNITLIEALNKLNSKAFVRQRIATTNGTGIINGIYNKEGVFFANVSRYITPSDTEQTLYIIGYSSVGKVSFWKIFGTKDYISKITCNNKCEITFTFSVPEMLCRVLFINN